MTSAVSPPTPSRNHEHRAYDPQFRHGPHPWPARFAALVDHGIAALLRAIARCRAWRLVRTVGTPRRNTGKNAYLHAFVALAASSAVVARRPRAQALLEEAMGITGGVLE